MSDFDLRSRTILASLFGSRAYGMSRPESDVDLRGVAVPPRAFFTGFRRKFEQADSREGLAVFADLEAYSVEERAAIARDGIDGAVYELRKFFHLAAQGNPNVLEALFTRDSEVRLITEEGRKLRAAKHLFLSRACLHTFSGYAFSQLKRIRNHRRWLLDPPKAPPTRADFGLKDPPVIAKNQLDAVLADVRRKVDGWELDLSGADPATRVWILEQIATSLAEIEIGSDERWMAACRLLGYGENFVLHVDRERRYRGAMAQWRSFRDWQKGRNERRAALEERHGYDTKHASQLVRLLRSCRQILEEGRFDVWRDDADELLAIRNGAMTYDEIVAYAEDEHRALKVVAQTSPLPKLPDYATLDALCVEIEDAVNART